jgi:uncharacterized protein
LPTGFGLYTRRPEVLALPACNNLGMTIEVVLSEDPEHSLAEATVFLSSDPVLHNLILTLLHERLAYPEPGRYWFAKDGDTIVGVVFQSPLDFAATITPMRPEVVAAVVDAIVEAGVALPGVIGEAATPARFAGQWTERQVQRRSPSKDNASTSLPGCRKER